MKRMSLWLAVSVALLALQYLTMPVDPMDASRWARFLVVVSKLTNVTLAAWVLYRLDVALFPYARPHEYFRPGHHLIGALLMLRRALIMAAGMVAVGLGT